MDVDTHLAAVEADGYTIVPDAIEADLLDRLDETLARLERELGAIPAQNAFEGRTTVRIYNLLALDPVFQEVPVHASVLPVIEAVIGKGCLVSSLSSIAIDPGEVAQPLHVDDAIIPLPRPHVPVICNSMWALTDFTAANGATRVVPGSHLSDHQPDPFGTVETVAAEMTRGSVLIWPGSTWHGGGANATDGRRMGLAMNYCAGWVRQQENQQLGIPLDVARTFSPALRKLCGFGVYRGLIGHIDKHDPAVLLLDEPTADEPATLFDRMSGEAKPSAPSNIGGEAKPSAPSNIGGEAKPSAPRGIGGEAKPSAPRGIG